MGLQGANKSAHWDGWEIETPLELHCTLNTQICMDSTTPYLSLNVRFRLVLINALNNTCTFHT